MFKWLENDPCNMKIMLEMIGTCLVCVGQKLGLKMKKLNILTLEVNSER